MSELRFDNKTVIVTGAGGGLGRAYALFFGSRGANVVVNDLGVSTSGEGKSKRAADVVVDEIKMTGGKAVANYDSVENGDKIVETAIREFGTVHILINNAGILRDVSFKNMKDEDWDLIIKVHIRGSYKCARACWPIFRKQSYGRIINTSSAAGVYGSFGQVNYSAAKMSMVSFSNTLAKEGAKYNILCNTIVPVAASRMTETVMPPDVLKHLNPEWVVPLVALLTHESTIQSGEIYELGAGFYSKLRYQRSSGALFKTDNSLTSSAILKKFSKICDFSNPSYPTSISDVNWVSMLEESKRLPKNEQGEKLDFRGKTVLVTGAGGGLGKAYALLFAKMGANVVVNDVMNPDATVKEIKAAGGRAIGDRNSVEDGESVVKTCIDAFGAIHVVINNAGILRDKSFNAMTDQQWDDVIKVHLKGSFKVTKAAWPYFLKQKYGRVLNTSSAVGLYGNFGQANYACAKSGLIGFTKALAREGAKYNILVNVIAPNAGTNMTATVWPEEMVKAFKPDYVAPLVCLLGHESCPSSGNIYEVGGGWVAQVRWQRSAGYGFPVDKRLYPEELCRKWKEIVTFDKRATFPNSPQDSVSAILENVNNVSGTSSSSATGDILSKVQKAKYQTIEYSYDDRDVILYNLGIGAQRTDLKWVFEGSEKFEVLPTFGVIPQFDSMTSIPYDDFLPNFSPMMLLHGEQYLEIKKFPIPTSGKLITHSKVLEVVDKQKAATVVIATETKDSTGEVLFANQSTVFVRGSGGFGGPTKSSDRGNASAANIPPKRAPDAVVEEKTCENQGAIYRLSGDRNPLHIDPIFAKIGKFPQPILHGLCSFGISGKHIYQKFGPFRNIKVRFAGHVFPGETLQTEMWKEGNKVIFQTKVIERNTTAISAAAAELLDSDTSVRSLGERARLS